MIALPAGVKVWLAAGATDMRKGFDGLAALVQTHLAEDPFSGQLFVFRGRAGDRVKVLWWSGDGLCLFAKKSACRWFDSVPGHQPLKSSTYPPLLVARPVPHKRTGARRTSPKM